MSGWDLYCFIVVKQLLYKQEHDVHTHKDTLTRRLKINAYNSVLALMHIILCAHHSTSLDIITILEKGGKRMEPNISPVTQN